MKEIDAIPEQVLPGSGYFAYAHGYYSSWISTLTIGSSKLFMGGGLAERVGKIRAGGVVRRESGGWKIFSLRDVTHNYGPLLFNAGAIAWEKAAAESGL